MPPWERKSALRELASDDNTQCVRFGDGKLERLGPPPTWERDEKKLERMALTTRGDVILMGFFRLARVSTDGKPLWETRFQEGHSCGAPSSLAVGWQDEIVISCGYSLMRFAPDGTFVWQKWPAGDTHLGQVAIDRDGAIYVTAGGKLIRTDSTGEPTWQASTGFNRWVHPFGLLEAGGFVFRTTMAARHSPTQNGVRRYYLHEPPELVSVSQDGKVIGRDKLEGAPAEWPGHRPWSRDGAFRIP